MTVDFKPTPGQLAAVETFRLKYDKARCKKLGVIDWVEALQVMWYNGRDYWEEGGGYLRQIRNTEGGFEWLLNQRR